MCNFYFFHLLSFKTNIWSIFLISKKYNLFFCRSTFAEPWFYFLTACPILHDINHVNTEGLNQWCHVYPLQFQGRPGTNKKIQLSYFFSLKRELNEIPKFQVLKPIMSHRCEIGVLEYNSTSNLSDLEPFSSSRVFRYQSYHI